MAKTLRSLSNISSYKHPSWFLVAPVLKLRLENTQRFLQVLRVLHYIIIRPFPPWRICSHDAKWKPKNQSATLYWQAKKFAAKEENLFLLFTVNFLLARTNYPIVHGKYSQAARRNKPIPCIGEQFHFGFILFLQTYSTCISVCWRPSNCLWDLPTRFILYFL